MNIQWIPPSLAGVALAALSTLIACRTGESHRAGRVAQPVFRAEKLATMDAAIETAIASKQIPGGVLWLEHRGHAYHKAYGHRALLPALEPMTEDTIFDAASLTKVVATAPSIMRLMERGQVSLDAPAAAYLPEFIGEGRDAITVRQLLTHTSGLRPGIGTRPDWSGYDEAIRRCCAERPSAAPDEKFIYSDTNFILLGEIVRRVSGQRLDHFARRMIHEPIGMRDTGFNPSPDRAPRIAPTEVQNGQPLRGIVHDPLARRMGGVAGHAGLFTTAHDLARYARTILRRGELDGVRILGDATVALMIRSHTPPALTVRRGLGWDIDSPYSAPRGSLFPIGSYGHTGWTGASLWIDPGSESFVIFLSNRNHPDGRGEVVTLRKTLGTLAAEAIVDFTPASK